MEPTAPGATRPGPVSDAGIDQEQLLPIEGVLMYVWLWRRLTGSVAVCIAQLVVLFLGVVALLMLVIFSWIGPHLPTNDVTVAG